jgi:SecD/SecF fusion protein
MRRVAAAANLVKLLARNVAMFGCDMRRIGLAAVMLALVALGGSAWSQETKPQNKDKIPAAETKQKEPAADVATKDVPPDDPKTQPAKAEPAKVEPPATKEAPPAASDKKEAEAPKAEAPKAEAPKTEAPKTEAPVQADPKQDDDEKKKGAIPRRTKRESLFQRIDTDQNGIISETELKAAHKTEEELPQKEFTEIDGDKSGGLSFPEFEAAYSSMLVLLAIILAVLIVPFVLGHFLTRQLRVPESRLRMSAVLFVLIASLVALAMGQLKYGIDLKGGVVLIYEVDEERSKQLLGEDQFTGQNYMESLIGALNLRVNPGGQKEVIVRSFGLDQVEIIIPDATAVEIESIKKRVADAGFLEFRITVNERKLRELLGPDYEAELEKVKQPTYPNEVKRPYGDEQELVALWSDVDVQRMPNVEIEEEQRRSDPREGGGSLILRRNAENKLQALLSAKDYVSGANLTFASAGFDERQQPEVRFSLNVVGGQEMGNITSTHRPDGNFHHRLAVVFDGKLFSAPNILDRPIFQEGRITGSFSQREVTDYVAVLNAGRLPAVVREEPVQQYQIGATLGEDTINTSWNAMAVSTMLVLGFMAVYYRFAGLVACLALLFNILITVAAVMFVQAPITLPGLAGLALTVGMAVDANVLIYERIREEQAKGASLRMVIRNGFDRAFTTIFDSNVTTVIVGIVLYIIGSDQVKGFAVTLIVGLFANLFTAITFTRLIFDLVEKKKLLSRISMMPALTRTTFDFVGKQRWCIGASAAMILIGLVAAFSRGVTLLDIDFAGGTSIHVLFKEDKPLKIDEVRELVHDKLPDVTVSDVRGTSELADTHYKIDTSLGNASSIVQSFDRRDSTEDGFLTLEEFLSEFSGERKGRVFDSVKRRFAVLDDDKDNKLSRNEFTINVEDVKRYWLEAIFGEQLRRNSVSFTPPQSTSATAAKPGEKEQSRGGSLRPNLLALAPGAMMLLAQQDDPAKTDTKPPAEKAPAEKVTESKPAAGTKTPPDAKLGEVEKAEKESPKDTPKESDTSPPIKDNPAALDKKEPQPSKAADDAKVASLDLKTQTTLTFAEPLSRDDVIYTLRAAAREAGLTVELRWRATKADPDSPTATVRDWLVESSATPAELGQIMQSLQQQLAGEPLFPAANSIGGQVAVRTKWSAIVALIVSFVAIIIYVWIRFQKVAYGVAGVVALVHDVLVMLGFIALSAYIVRAIGLPAEAIGLSEFKINLPVVAAFMTIIGFSINDTIVIFDRIRELKGKLPYVTADLVNSSVNQMLGRTFITSATVITVVVILYGWGGAEIHGFAFAMLVGLVSGVYSTWFVATPIVLWMAGPPAPAVVAAATPRSQPAALSTAAANRGNASPR